MHNFFAKFGKVHEICKLFSKDLVNEKGYAPRHGVVSRFSDLEVIALTLTAETESIDSENRLVEMLKKSKDEIPNLISRRQYNDRRKLNAGLCKEIRRRMALAMDGGEDYFYIDSKPVEVCRVALGKRCKMGKAAPETAPNFGFCASQGVYYFGYKLHSLCGLSGVILSYDLTKASVHDINYHQNIKPLYHDCSIFEDKGYISASVQLDLFESANIKLECPYRLNQKKLETHLHSFRQKMFRQRKMY